MSAAPSALAVRTLCAGCLHESRSGAASACSSKGNCVRRPRDKDCRGYATFACDPCFRAQGRCPRAQTPSCVSCLFRGECAGPGACLLEGA